MNASPDGLVTEPSETDPFGLVESAYVEKILLSDLCTDKQLSFLQIW